LITLIQL